jgi:lipoate-protein ligase A
MKIKIYLSDSHDPWFNLATEDFLFKHTEESAVILFLWRNSPSVVIGRAQNPYLECQLAQMEQDDVLLARRQSGGGTVYHDLGNLNFTFISPTSGPYSYAKEVNFNVVLEALSSLNIPAIRSPRNDLWISYHGENRKISGSAFRETKHRAFHHGTLLIDSNLDRLSRYLAPSTKKIEAKGVKSVRSPVINLIKIQPTLTMAEVQTALITSFQAYYGPASIETLCLQTLAKESSLNQTYEEYRSWEWRFGRTLPFHQTLEKCFPCGETTLSLKVENGIIQTALFLKQPYSAEEIAPYEQALTLKRYERMALQDALLPLTHLKDIQSWLMTEIL